MEPLQPTRTAVLVIDVQAALFTGNTPPFAAEEVLQNISLLLEHARQANALIIFIQHDGSAEDGLLPNTPGWQLHPTLNISPRDHILRKTTCDAFYRTDLEPLLRSHAIDTLVLAGYATDFCIDSTLRNAISKDFRVIVASDAHTTHDAPTSKAAHTLGHFNWVWQNCSTRKPIEVTPTTGVMFRSS